MGKDLADHFSAARDVFTEVDDVLEQLISKKMFHGTQVLLNVAAAPCAGVTAGPAHPRLPPLLQEDLSQTEVTQPALLAHSVAAYRVAQVRGAGLLTPCRTAAPAPPSHAQRCLALLQAECGLSVVSPSACAVLGHSVGEYAALVIAGSMTLADAARLLQLRGRSMQAAADAEVQRLARRAGGAAKAVSARTRARRGEGARTGEARDRVTRECCTRLDR